MTTSYLILTPYGSGGYGPPLVTETTQTVITKDVLGQPVAANTLLALSDYDFEVEQTLNLGSQGSGSGAGKVAFDVLRITKPVDTISPLLFQACCSGTPFGRLDLLVARAGQLPQVFLQYTFKLAAVATIDASSGDENPREEVAFAYAGLQVRYAKQNPDGSMGSVVTSGWNRVKNVSDVTQTPL